MLLGVLLSVLWLGAAAPAARAVPIRITYTDGSSEGFNDPGLGSARRRAFEAAASVWGRRLGGSVPIEISASFDPLGGTATRAVLGQASPQGLFANWDGPRQPPLSNTYYVYALANNLAGSDLAPDEVDITAQFNSDVDGPDVLGSTNFYYGLDGVSGSDSDFFATALHEMGHGLGFTGLFNRDGSSQSETLASFDRFIADGPGLDANLITSLSNEERSIAFRSDSLYFAGPRARAASGGRNARLYAPADFSDGSSIYHTDEDTYHGAEELMTPFSSGNPHDAGPITFAIFLDIGWGSVGASTSPTPAPAPTPTGAPLATPTPAALRPPNDDFARAQVLAGASGRVTGSTINATKQSGEPNHAGNLGSASVWYRWAAPFSGRASFSTAGSSFDTLLAVYTGSAVNALSAPLQGSQGDDAGQNDATSRIAFAAVAGRTYFIAVDGYSDTSGAAQGSVALSWSLAPPGPANDDFARAQVLAGSAGRVAGTTLNATLQPGEPAHGGAGRSVWYRWSAPSAGRWTFTTQGSSLDTTLDLFSGTALNELRRIGIDDDDPPLRTSSVTVAVSAAAVIFVAVDSKGTLGGPFVLSFGAAPANDDAGAAQVLAGDAGSVSQSTSFASRQAGEPAHAGFLGNRSVWFRWVPAANGLATWRTTGSNFDTLLAIYTGAPVAALARVASVDNDAGALTGTVSFNVTAGTVYWIAVDGKNASSGSLVLSWSLQRAPSNDLFANAQVLAGLSGAVVGSNKIASIEPGEYHHAGIGAGRSVWFRWTAPESGLATFVLYSSYFKPVLVAYEGTAVGSLQSVSSQVSRDDNSMIVALNAVAGHTYSVAVDSYNLGALTTSGGFSLRWSLSPTSTRTALAARQERRLALWMP